MDFAERIELASRCKDCDVIDKVDQAGQVQEVDSGKYQIMHNGIKVFTDTHYGDFNVEVIRRLKGHHEPQEEFVFNEVLGRLGSGCTMIELGSFWAYYSSWFLKENAGGKAILIEPVPEFLEAGQRNLGLNNLSGQFIHAAISDKSTDEGEVELWPGKKTVTRSATVDSIIEECGLDRVEILHSDIQGAEVRMLRGAKNALRRKQVQWVFISTHGENVHQCCIKLLRMHGYSLIAHHTPKESFSVDGLIVASASSAERPVKISRNRTWTSQYLATRAYLRVRLLEPLGLKMQTL